MVTESGTYWVEAENTCGSSSDTVRVIFPALNELSIPNVFTPNGDKVNERFEIDERLLGSPIEIFHRNGKKIFESPNYQNNWDGNDLPSGTYFYFIKSVCESKYKGWITIMY